MQTWENGSKKNLPAGPWSKEPDKAQWVDPETQLDCLIVRSSLGALCGYVGVPPGHPWHGQEYDSVPASVHGGLTYAASCNLTEDPAAGICHVPLKGRPEHVHWLGFDCAHYMDQVPAMESLDLPDLRGLRGTYRDFEYVRAECTQLAAQAAEASR